MNGSCSFEGIGRSVRERALAKGLVLTWKIQSIHVSAEEAFPVVVRLNVVYMTVGIVTAC